MDASNTPCPNLTNPTEATDMENGADSTMFPKHCYKIIHLVRHAQGDHNVSRNEGYEEYRSPKYFDPELTPLGWQQVDNLRKHVRETGICKRIELVIASPLLRALQTAVGVFGGAYGTDELPLMVENAGNSGQLAVSSLDCPTFIATELCRACLGIFSSDKRRNVSDYRILFPAIDVSLMETDEDILWNADVRETDEELTARAQKFIKWLWTRKEKEIAIVNHVGFLTKILAALGNDCRPLEGDQICKYFAHGELYSMIIVDRSMTDSGTVLPL